MAQNLGCCGFIILKIVDNNILWNKQNAPDRTIFINFSGGWGHAPGPLAQVLIHIITGLTTRLVCTSLSR